MNLQEQLDHERRIIDAATDGPWVALGNDIAAEVKTCTCADNIPGCGHGQYCGLDGPLITGAAPADAEFIVHARTALPQRNAQIQAVLELHYPVQSPIHPRTVCAHRYCKDDDLDQCEWPCPTIRAIEGK